MDFSQIHRPTQFKEDNEWAVLATARSANRTVTAEVDGVLITRIPDETNDLMG
jgi:hypothetical protein